MTPRGPLVLVATLLLAVAGPPRAGHADAGWQWPVPTPHRVLRAFEPPAHDWLAGHRGVDLAAGAGTVITAAGSGTVSFAGRIADTPVVAVRHASGLETTYEPVVARVRKGQVVQAGTALGRLAAAAGHCSSGACLHWGLRRGADYLDPLSLVGAARVRLLPMLTAPPGWVVPAASGASLGSSAVAAGWALTVARRRRRRLPPGVTSIAAARAQRAGRGRDENTG